MFKPVELSSKVKGFYSHVSFEHMLSQGWDFEEGPQDFFSRKMLEDENFGERAYVTVKHPDGLHIDVSEHAIFLASLGQDTMPFRELMFAHSRNIKAHFEAKGMDIDPTIRVDVSMHSGSSDYLFVSDVLDYIEKVLALG